MIVHPVPAPEAAARQHRQAGFTLVLTLIVLAAITILVLGLFANVTSETSTATNYDNAFRAQTAVRSGLSRAEALLKRGTWSDDYLVLEHLQNPPEAGTTPTPEEWRQRKPVLTLARANIKGETTTPDYTTQWEYLPLTSGVIAPEPTNGTPALPSTPLQPATDRETNDFCQPAVGLPKRMPWQPAQDSFWEVIYEERDTDNNPQTPAVKVPVSRYCFQVEDLQGLLSLDHAGNPGDEVELATGMVSRPHEREKIQIFQSPTDESLQSHPRLWYAGLAPGLRTPDDEPSTDDRRWVMSQVPLYSLIDPTATYDATPVDNYLMVARQTRFPGRPTQVASLLQGPDSWKPIVMSEDISNPWPSWLQRTPQSILEDGTPASFDENTGRLPDSAARRLEENTITGLRPYYEYPLIPAEPGVFAHPREPRMNLNRVLTQVENGSITSDEAVKLIANHIQRHLPTQVGSSNTLMDGFAKRGGGFPFTEPTPQENAPAYLQNLAASIIDYADTDCLPIMVPGLYRGFDSAPVIHEHMLAHKWESSTIRNGSRFIRYTATYFYELWNMSNRPIRGEFEAEHINKIKIQVGPGNYLLDEAYEEFAENAPYGADGSYWMPLYPPDPNSGKGNATQAVVTLRPNEITVLASMPITYEFNVGPFVVDEITVSDDNSSRIHVRFEPETNTYNPTGMVTDVPVSKAAAKFVTIDRTGAGVERNQRILKLTPILQQQQFACNPINFSTGDSSNTSNLKNNNGDPRASFYMTDVQTLAKYASDGNGQGGASPWGRNKRKNVDDSSKIYSEVFPSRWGDRGHDGPSGVYPGTNAFTPFSPSIVAAKPAYTDEQSRAAPMRISNAGRYFSVTELGNIYDPLFWKPNGSSNEVTWTTFDDIGVAYVPNAFHSGGHTLRIGRPEHTLFRSRSSGGAQTNRRLSASTLLDLFHCGISTTGSLSDETNGPANLRDLTGPLVEINGQVNVNTASKEVLCTLIAGGVKTDPWIPNAETSSQATMTLVESIMRNRPYLSTSEIPEKARGSNNKPLFGDTKMLPLFGSGTEWNDTAAEEVFARLYNSTTVRSRHFRVYVTGQAIRPTRSDPSKLEVLSTRSRVAHVFVQPLRDPTTGLIQDQRVQILYEQDL